MKNLNRLLLHGLMILEIKYACHGIEHCGIRVAFCPSGENAWIAKSKTFTCRYPNTYYVCIMNQNRDLFDVCIINHTVPSGQVGCPFVSHCDNKGPLLAYKDDFLDCPKEKNGCPDEHNKGYSVLELYKYPACIGVNVTEDSLTVIGNEFVTSETTVTHNYISLESSGLQTSIIVLIVIICLVIAICVVLFIYKRRKAKRRRGKGQEGDGGEEGKAIDISKGEEDDDDEEQRNMFDESKGEESDDGEEGNMIDEMYPRLVPTTYQKVCGVIEKKQNVIIVGKHDSFRNALKEQLRHDYGNKRSLLKRYVFEYTCKIENFKSKYKNNEIKLCMIDDWSDVGTHDYDDQLQKIKFVRDKLLTHKFSNNILLVMITPPHVWKDAYPALQALQEKDMLAVIEISDSEIQMSTNSKFDD